MEHPDAVVYRRTADAFRAGDMETLAQLFDPEVIWHIPARVRWPVRSEGAKRSGGGSAACARSPAGRSRSKTTTSWPRTTTW